MLARYKICRGKRDADDPLPEGIRQDTRWRTRHLLRPTEAIVERFLAAPSDEAWVRLARDYLALLEVRLAADRTAFDKLAKLARENDVFLGCSCPTIANPRVDHCHTYLALKFMKKKYRELQVVLPRR